jgi:hypothetical protein
LLDEGVRVTHPRDQWLEITGYGDRVPRFVLAVDGRELEVSEAQAEYVHGRITVEELEARIGAALGLVGVES